MADEQQKKQEIISKSGKFWRNLFIGVTIFLLVVILFLLSISIKQLSEFLTNQGGILFVGLMAFGLIAAILFFLLKKKENIQDINIIVSEIRQKEYSENGIIINPTKIFAEELAPDLLLIEFEEVDECDGEPPLRKVYCYDRKSRNYFPFSLGTKRDAKANIEKSEFNRRFLWQYEAEQKLKDLQEKFGVVVERG